MLATHEGAHVWGMECRLKLGGGQAPSCLVHGASVSPLLGRGRHPSSFSPSLSLGPPWLTPPERYAGGQATPPMYEAVARPPPSHSPAHKPCPALPLFNDLLSPLLVGQSVHTSSTLVVSPVDRSHTLAVLSTLPVASCRPSGLKATLMTPPVWP